MTRILGLDVATTTGFAVLDGSGIIEYGLIKIESSDSLPDKLKFLRRSVLKVVKQFSPDMVALETVFHGRNVTTTALLNNMRGAVIVSLPKKVKVVNVHPKTAKKDILGHGGVGKEDVFNWCVGKYKIKGLKFNKHNDITDAVLLASWVSRFYKDSI